MASALERFDTVAAVWGAGAVWLQAVSDAPRLEAQILLAQAMGLRRTDLLTHPERWTSPDQAAAFWLAITHRAAGQPLPHLTGRAEFYGLDFKVGPDVLIPRPETETLIDLALARAPQTVVDVGTGSGCVAVTLAAHLPQARVWATDVSLSALRVAAANVRQHGLVGRVCLVQCDLAMAIRGPVDLIVANLPYVTDEEWQGLPASVRRYEPALALRGGPDGLAPLRRLLQSGRRVLRAGGTFLLEIGAGQGQAAAALARALVEGARVVVHPDLAGRDRVLEVTG